MAIREPMLKSNTSNIISQAEMRYLASAIALAP
jgi:hypothetical protein